MVDALSFSNAPLPFHHVSVMPEVVLEGLQISSDSGGSDGDEAIYLDTTVGGGGHSVRILETHPTTRVMALDQDLIALAAAQARLAQHGDRVTFHHVNFAEFDPGSTQFNGILADLGVSSPQLDTPERGFSFRQEAPLDMRMNQTQDLTAEDIINHWDEAELARILFVYGEERLSRRIARNIVAQRPFQTTTGLAEAIARCVPAKYRYGRIHPATRSFQALRIAVNAELEMLETFLAKAPDWLLPGGRIVIISFHSLEDRIVKQTFRNSDRLKVITKKPLVATPEEIQANPRARSAKLRVAERVLA